jgi:hypothetical protein
MKLTASTTLPTTTPCPIGADGCGLSPVKREVPGSTPGILHHSWAGAIGLPPRKRSRSHQPVREIKSRGCSSVGRAQRLTTTSPIQGRRLRVTASQVRILPSPPDGPTQPGYRTSRARATRRGPAGISRSRRRDSKHYRGFSRSHPLARLIVILAGPGSRLGLHRLPRLP